MSAADDFAAYKADLDGTLNSADSSWNLVQAAAVKPYRDAEATLVAGMAKAVAANDLATQAQAAQLMYGLAGDARRFFLDGNGEVKSQSWDAAVSLAVDTGNAIQEKAKGLNQGIGGLGQGLEDAASTLKWVVIAVVVLLGGLVVYKASTVARVGA